MSARLIEKHSPEWRQVISDGVTLVDLDDPDAGPSGLTIYRHDGKLYVAVGYESIWGSIWEFTIDDLLKVVGDA